MQTHKSVEEVDDFGERVGNEARLKGRFLRPMLVSVQGRSTTSERLDSVGGSSRTICEEEKKSVVRFIPSARQNLRSPLGDSLQGSTRQRQAHMDSCSGEDSTDEIPENRGHTSDSHGATGVQSTKSRGERDRQKQYSNRTGTAPPKSARIAVRTRQHVVDPSA